jgi:hypothetical protein
MFSYLLIAIIEFCLTVLIVSNIYDIFLGDYVRQWKEKIKKKNSLISSANKIAQVKLISNDDKDIEKFISANADHLSNEMIAKLVARIEVIRDDQVINADNILKTRIDALAKNKAQALTLEEEAEPVGQVARR